MTELLMRLILVLTLPSARHTRFIDVNHYWIQACAFNHQVAMNLESDNILQRMN